MVTLYKLIFEITQRQLNLPISRILLKNKNKNEKQFLSSDTCINVSYVPNSFPIFSMKRFSNMIQSYFLFLQYISIFFNIIQFMAQIQLITCLTNQNNFRYRIEFCKLGN